MILKRLKNQRGNATEFVLAFMFVSSGLLVVINFIVFAIANELSGYAAYMSSRALKVYGDPVPVVQQITPWAIISDLKIEEEDGLEKGKITIKSGKWIGMETALENTLSSAMFFETRQRLECEDNPLWYAGGGEECP